MTVFGILVEHFQRARFTVENARKSKKRADSVPTEAALALVAWAAFSTPAPAQETASSPYAGLEARAIKALSPQEIDDLRSGRGMGLALAAELNGYPGPMHVLEHAEALALTAVQRSKLQTLLTAMRAASIALGERVIAAEQELDDQFATGRANPALLNSTTAEIARLRGELRATHLRYHLVTRHLLERAQIERYSEIRGYIFPHRPGHAMRH